jgi:multiple antibiotic resistance protein
MTMTADLSVKERNRTAKKATIVALLTIILFALSGQLLFNFFGISVNSFRIVGGVIFFIMGMDMLQARLGQVKIKDSEVKTYVNDISVVSTPANATIYSPMIGSSLQSKDISYG